MEDTLRDLELRKYLSGSDSYDECFERVDNETHEHVIEITKIVKDCASMYNIDTKQILVDMLYPSIEAELF